MTFADKLLSLIGLLLGVLILALPTAIITLPKGGALVLLMLILSLVGLSLHKIRVNLEPWEQYFVLSFLAYFLVVALSVWWFDGDLNNLDTPSRLALVLPIFFFIRKAPISNDWIILGIAIAAITIGVNQLLLKLTGGTLYNFQDNSGIVTLYASIFGLSSLFFIHQNHGALRNLALGVAALMGVLASLLSGGRGVWIAAFLSIIIILMLNPMRWHAHVKPIVFSVFVCAILVAYLIPQTHVKTRIDKAIDNVSAWVETGQSYTSSGARLEMWKAAYEIIQSNPIIGVGEGNYAQHKQVLINQGKIDQSVEQFNHPHGEYISNLVEQGVVGLLAFLMVLLTPIKAAFHAAKKNVQHGGRVPIVLAMVIVLHYAFYSVTSGVFDHQSTTLFYAVFIAIALGLIKSHSKEGV